MGQIRCNQCGRELMIQDGSRKEDCLRIVKEWGYFSEKDREIHEFYLCEHCYDKLLQEFVIPVEKRFVEEIL